jgi:hypothetical protein
MAFRLLKIQTSVGVYQGDKIASTRPATVSLLTLTDIDGLGRQWQNGYPKNRKENFMAAVLPPLVMILLLAGIFYLAWREANKEK